MYFLFAWDRNWTEYPVFYMAILSPDEGTVKGLL